MSAACIARNDWRRLLATPFGWLLLGAAIGLLAYDFLARIDVVMLAQEQLSEIGSVTDSVMIPVIAQATQLIVLMAALMSLRGFAAELRLGTFTLLRSAPVSSWQLATGKLVGQLALPMLLVMAVLLMAVSLELGTSPDWGRIAAGLLGLVLLAGACATLGLLISSLVGSPALAATLTFCLLILLWIADFAPRSRGVDDSYLYLISFATHFRPFLSGAINLSSVIFYLGVSSGLLLSTAIHLDLRLGRQRKSALLALVVVMVTAAIMLAHRYDRQWDLTASGRNSLSSASVQLLDSLDQPVTITAYASQSRALRQSIADFLAPYQFAKPDLTVKFVDPASNPDLVRKLNIQADGELLIDYQHQIQQRLQKLGKNQIREELYHLLPH